MVDTQFIPAVRRQLEKFLIKKNEFQLRGQTYDLILLVPSDRYSMDTKYSLFISCKQFDAVQRITAITDLLTFLKEYLNPVFYNIITRVDFIHSDDPFVQSMKMVFAFKQPLYVINDVSVAGVHIEFGYLIKSQILDRLIENDAVTIVYESNGKVQYENAGLIKMNPSFVLIYYTPKGLDEIRNFGNRGIQKLKDIRGESEVYLEENGFMSRIVFDAIIMLE
jgi:hypothetical protein